MNSTDSIEDLRDRIMDGYLYNIVGLNNQQIMTGCGGARMYYDQMLLNGDSPEDIVSTITQHRDEGAILLTNLIRSTH